MQLLNAMSKISSARAFAKPVTEKLVVKERQLLGVDRKTAGVFQYATSCERSFFADRRLFIEVRLVPITLRPIPYRVNALRRTCTVLGRPSVFWLRPCIAAAHCMHIGTLRRTKCIAALPDVAEAARSAMCMS